MTAREWERAKELFSAAIELGEPERETFLQSQPGSSETLDEVRSLLAAYNESPDFLDEAGCGVPGVAPFPAEVNGEGRILQRLRALAQLEPANGPIPQSTDGLDGTRCDASGAALLDGEWKDGEWEPEHIGAYRIVRRLGEGGMGIAYLAERDDGTYHHQVAIKVLKNGSHDLGLERRFAAERQVLAELQHPFIARLIDGGTTASGHSYYVMEYVPGEPVTKHANSHGLDLRNRLILFMAVCEAVAAAHRQLVIHGDIKPANILINADNSPKLLDFGLARLIRPGNDVTTSMVLLTPGYASPEQVLGERLSTATDVYSLGVVLYELLIGESPYGGATHSPMELCRAICDAAPSKPSSALKTAIPGLTPRRFRGDLDQIVLKTLRKSPHERYASVDELREDIQRYIYGFPVKATRGSGMYRIRKFALRNRWFVAGGSVLLILAGLAIWQIWRAEKIAEQRFNDVRQLAHTMIFDVHDAIQDLPGSTSARSLLVGHALSYLKGLEATGGHSRDLELELARAYARIGTLQADAARASMDNCAAGVQNLEHARSLLKGILKRGDTGEDVFSALIDADLSAANVHARRGEMNTWRALHTEATTLLNGMAARHPKDSMLRLRSLISVAQTLDGEHDAAAALKAYQDAIAAAKEAPDNQDIRLLEARTERNIAEEVQELGDKRSALDHQRAALRIFEELLAATPLNTRLSLETSWSYTETAWLEHDFHEDRAAIADFDKAMRLLRTITTADPGNRLARLETGKLELTEAPTVELTVGANKSAELLRDAISIFGDALELDPTNDDARVHMAQTQLSYGDLQVRMAHHDPCAGVDAYRKAWAAASGVKHDFPATSVFDMKQTRDALHERLAACTPDAGRLR